MNATNEPTRLLSRLDSWVEQVVFASRLVTEELRQMKLLWTLIAALYFGNEITISTICTYLLVFWAYLLPMNHFILKKLTKNWFQPTSSGFHFLRLSFPLSLYRGRLRRNSTVIIFFRCPPLKTSKIFKAPPPPPNRQNKNINFGPPSSSLSLFRETKIDNGTNRQFPL
jgi:hypothetical protein